MYEIRDPIHRTIDFSEDEKRIVDHPFVQRLRNVRQLGLSYLVYPGATHDRFSHAIGTMHVAGRIWSRILETSGGVLRAHFSDDDLRYFGKTLRLGGLLHDVGHPPFSHVAERFMPRLAELDLPAGWLAETEDRVAKHEDYSVALIAAMARERDASLGVDQARDIASLVHHGVKPSETWGRRYGAKTGGEDGIHRLLRALISGELDCDRMDYLLRDAYFTGAAYGLHDIEHLIGNLGVVDRTDSGLTLTIDSTAVRAFEDFLLARYHMFLQVYFHKTTAAFDYYLDRAIMEGEFSIDLPGDALGYSKLRDSTILEKLFAAAEDAKNVWSRRLAGRRPPKMLLMISNAKDDDRVLMDHVVTALRESGVSYFTTASRQRLSSQAPHSMSDRQPSGLLVRRKILGKFIYEPVERYSSLLNKYNEVIDISHLYVLHEDLPRAMAAIGRLDSWLQPG